jgi:hypothetical protein
MHIYRAVAIKVYIADGTYRHAEKEILELNYSLF